MCPGWGLDCHEGGRAAMNCCHEGVIHAPMKVEMLPQDGLDCHEGGRAVVNLDVFPLDCHEG
jgi:hypothetical protein